MIKNGYPYLLAILATILGLFGCQSSAGPSHSAQSSYLKIRGETMGTYYQITYRDSLERDLQPGIDSLLLAINEEVSTYIDSSVISRFNQSVDGLQLTGTERHFIINLMKSREVHALSEGAFDPTVMPLVNYWGFGYTGKNPVTRVDSLEVGRLRRLVGLSRITGVDSLGPSMLRKPDPGMQLDFSAIAKGYGVDQVGAYLESHGVKDYLVDIGGEALARGLSPRGAAWRIGINLPSEEAGLADLYSSVEIRDKALATSGNYRNLYESNGVKFSHTINPFTGFPERRYLLSASIVADDCMTADALATTCMVLGLERSRELIEGLSGVDAYLIFSAEDGSMAVWASTGMAAYSPTR